MSHDVRPGADALPFAFHAIVDPLIVPSAVPATLSSPAHVALNDPFALVVVCSVTFHLKSVHVLGDGMMLAEDQLPISAPTPTADGPVMLLLRSNPRQPAAAAAAHTTTERMRFFMA